jgi:hypothetical protein
MGLFLYKRQYIPKFFMNSNKITTEKSLQDFYHRVSKKNQAGFVVKEKNDILPFAILSKSPKSIDHTLNFALFCLTFGLWSIGWLYLIFIYGKEKRILIAIDEDGKTFVESCY